MSDEALEAALERITTSVEGLVFDYDGKTYKFTGQFAPINQMLGLGKYDRGAKETVSEDLEDDDPYDYREDMEQWEREQYYADLEDEESAGPKTVVLFPGAFKPPHAGHYAAAKYYADNPDVDEVQVIISKSDRAEHTEKERLSVTPEISLEFWNQYTAGDSKIKPRVTIEPSPIRDAYKVMENMEPGSTVMFVMGEKDAKCGDERFAAVRDYALKHGLNYDCDPVTEKQTGVAEDLSATEMRRYVLARKKEPFFAQLPAHLSDEQKELIFNLLERGIQKKTNESISSLTDLRRLVEQVISEKYESKSCTKESGESGNCKVTFDDGHTACYDNCGVAKKATSGELNEDEIEEVSTAGGHAGGPGSIEGPPGPRRRKKKNNSLIREDDEQYVKEVLDYILSRGTVNANRS